MKTSFIKYLALFFLFFCIELHAQDKAGTKSAVPSKTSAKGRHELRKDKKVKHNEEQSLKTNGEKLEAKSDKPFHKKEHRKTPHKEKRKREGELVNKK